MVVKHEYFVGYQYIDTDYKIKNSALLSMFEDLACMHGSRVGEDIRTAPTVWLLSAYKVKIIRRPEYGEYITACTWSRGMRGVLAQREFEIRSAAGELLVCALSEWVHVFKAGGPARVTAELEAAYESEPERTNFPGERLRPPRECTEYDSEMQFTVGRIFIDVNDHMNNVHYAEISELILPDVSTASYNFEIYYRKEIKCGETVVLRHSSDENTHTVTVKSADGAILHSIIKYTK